MTPEEVLAAIRAKCNDAEARCMTLGGEPYATIRTTTVRAVLDRVQPAPPADDDVDLARIRSRLSGLHFAQDTMRAHERETLHLAEELLARLDRVQPTPPARTAFLVYDYDGTSISGQPRLVGVALDMPTAEAAAAAVHERDSWHDGSVAEVAVIGSNAT